MKKRALLFIAIILLLIEPASAKTGSPSCTTNGEIARIATAPSLQLICNDGAWVLMKQSNANGNVRVVTSPNAKDDDCSGTCSKGGEFCYASGRMRLCDGSKWFPLYTTFAPTVGCPQSGIFNGAQSQVLTVADGCAVTFKAWGGGGGGGTGGNAGSGGDYGAVSLRGSGKNVTYYLSVGGGGGSGNYMTAGVGGSGVTGQSGGNGSWHIIAGGTGGGGAASGVWTEGLGVGKAVVVAAGGKGSASDAGICTSTKSTTEIENCGSAPGGGDRNYPPGSGIRSEAESPGNADDTDRPSGAGEGGAGVDDPSHNAEEGNDGAIHWATCAETPCP